MRSAQRILCLWLPDWPVQRRRARDASLRRRAVVLVTENGRGAQVAACCNVAREAGVRIGTAVNQAHAVAGVGRLAVEPHRPAEDRRALARLADEGLRFCPVVALEEAQEPSALLMDATGLWPLWDATHAAGETRLARSVAQWAAQHHLTARVAIADTVGLAWGVACSLQADAEPRVVPSAETRHAAAQLSTSLLRIDPEHIERLHSFDLLSVGRLLELPRASLPARFGRQLTRRVDQLLGDAPEPLTPHHARPPLVERWRYETSVAHPGVLEQTVNGLLERLAGRLAGQRLGVQRLLVEYHEDAPQGERRRVRLPLRLSRATACQRELIELVALHTAGLSFAYPVSAIELRVGSTAPIEPRQRLLFEREQSDDPHELELLVNRLVVRVGADRVHRVEKRKSHSPQRAFAYVPAVDVPASDFRLTPLQAEQARRAPIAMDAARRATSVRMDENYRPVAVKLAGWQPVTRSWGPERIETGWWRGRGLRRDAYWVELADGARLWLWHDLRAECWEVAGEF